MRPGPSAVCPRAEIPSRLVLKGKSVEKHVVIGISLWRSQPGKALEASSLTVARNCDMASSSLRIEVDARQAPHRPRRKLRIEVASINDTGHVPGHLQFSFDEGAMDDEFHGFIGKVELALIGAFSRSWQSTPRTSG